MFIKIFVDTVKYGYGYNIFKGYLGVHTNNNLKILLSLPPEVMYEIAYKKHNVNEKGNRMSDKNDGFYLSDANFNILKKNHYFAADNTDRNTGKKNSS
ncbi:hypothetical protein H8356DRAFT_1323959 [Neocallimastix lanati (nom. inval.)]|nr:hypothetical protein H8356DRAFT_1323959 [Neocallimastix sp. JGI-2020a]